MSDITISTTVMYTVSPSANSLLIFQPVTGCQAPAVLQRSVCHASPHETRSHTAEISSYRPISNLPVISERLVTKQLADFLQSADLLPSLQSGLATPRRPLPCGCFPTSSRPSTVVMLQRWSFWTNRLHLILSTMRYCVDVCRCLMVWVALCWTGFGHICMGSPSMSDVALLSLQGHG